MKKVCAAILALILFLCSCGSQTLGSVSETEKIAIIVDGECLIQVSGTGADEFCENLMSLRLKKMKSTDPTIELCTLEFLDSGGNVLQRISVSLEGWISINGKSYYAAVGELDTSWIKTHISIAQNHEPAPNPGE